MLAEISSTRQTSILTSVSVVISTDCIKLNACDPPTSDQILSSLDPALDAQYNSRNHAPQCLKGTREAVIADIVQCIDGGGDRPICWLNGSAGSGKSAIAQTVAEVYADRNCLVGSFFFFRGAGHRSDISR